MHLNYISFHNQFKLIRPPIFFIEDAIFDPNTYQMILALNRPAANWLEMKVNDFKVYYKGKRLQIKKVARVSERGDTYAISFLRKGKAQRKRLDFLFSNIEDLDKSSLAIIVNGMKDTEGNLIAERKTEFIDQFREFFTQKLVDDVNIAVPASTKVKKELSLGDSTQPKLDKSANKNFWMNTPLKTIPQE